MSVINIRNWTKELGAKNDEIEFLRRQNANLLSIIASLFARLPDDEKQQTIIGWNEWGKQ